MVVTNTTSCPTQTHSHFATLDGDLKNFIFDNGNRTPTPLSILPISSSKGSHTKMSNYSRSKNKRAFRLNSGSLINSKFKRVKGKLHVQSRYKFVSYNRSSLVWQPDSIDIERVNDRLKQPLVDVHKEANATLLLSKALGLKFDKSDSVVQ